MRLILALLLTAIAAYPQVTTARYGGVLTDITGLPLLQGTVHLMETRTGLTYKAAVEEGGRFQIPAITPGVYTVRVESPGFATRVIHDYALSTGEAAEETIEMELAELNITVEVVGKAPGVRVQTADAQISRILTLKELDLLPQLGRDPMALAAYQPGVQFDSSFSRVNGTRRGSTNVRQDGLINVDPVFPRFGLNAAATNLDAIGEVRIVLSGGKAEYGRNAGAQIDLVSRSGSNKWSGNLFAYHRNTALNANTWFNNFNRIGRPKLILNTFGASLGGPLRRNRTFFFLNYQGCGRRRTWCGTGWY